MSKITNEKIKDILERTVQSIFDAAGTEDVEIKELLATWTAMTYEFLGFIAFSVEDRREEIIKMFCRALTEASEDEEEEKK